MTEGGAWGHDAGLALLVLSAEWHGDAEGLVAVLAALWDGAALVAGQTVEVVSQLGVELDLLSQKLTQLVVLEVHLLELLTEGLVALDAGVLHGLQVLLDEVEDDLLLLDLAAGGEEVDDEVIGVARLQDGRWLDDAPR